MKKIVFNNLNDQLYTNISLELKAEVYDEANLLRKDQPILFSSNNPKVVDVNKIGILTTKKVGKAKITATAGDVSKELEIRVIKNPIKRLSLSIENKKIRTGDVERISVEAYDRRDRLVDDAPIYYSYSGKADYGRGLPASAQITSDGRFVAETAGMYTVSATSNGYSKSQIIEVIPRDVAMDIELVGFGLVSNVKTSDLWIWPGVGKHKGKAFAVTGT